MNAPQSEDRPDVTQAAPSSSLRWIDDQVTSIFPLLTLLVVGTFVYWNAALNRAPTIDIIAATRGEADHWTISGRTVRRSDAIPIPARVWVVAADARGNRFMPTAAVSTSDGAFTLPPIPRTLGGEEDVASFATIFASYADTARTASLGVTLTGEESIRLSSTGRVRRVDPPSWPFVLVAVLFAWTMWLALYQGDRVTPQKRRARYQTLVGFSFLFTFVMLALLVIGLRHINSGANAGDVVSLGFANVYQGSYVKGGTREWLFSLTSPTSTGQGLDTEVGLGAPLWTILVSVLGAAIFTISLLVKHVKEPMDPDNEASYRTRIEELVRHQFYIFFAPLGALLVYQLMVAGNAAAAPVTVAFAILAAGTAMNLLLDKAVTTLQGALSNSPPAGPAAAP